jgi:NADH:ubiquinone oxidoreductase subunit 4 (subunit M)
LLFVGVLFNSFWLFFLFLPIFLFTLIFSMWTFVRICFGTLRLFRHSFFIDLTAKEFYVLLILLILTIYFGIKPSIIINTVYCLFTLYAYVIY